MYISLHVKYPLFLSDFMYISLHVKYPLFLSDFMYISLHVKYPLFLSDFMYIILHVKYPLFLSDFMRISLHVKYLFSCQIFLKTWIFSTHFGKIQISNFLKIRPVGIELLQADGRTDMTKLIVAFRSFSKAPKKEKFALEEAFKAQTEQ